MKILWCYGAPVFPRRQIPVVDGPYLYVRIVEAVRQRIAFRQYGRTTIGVVRGNQWLLRNTNTPGPADISFTYGQSGDVPVVGHWTDAGIDLPGVVRGSQWRLRNQLSGGSANVVFDFGSSSADPVVGDWNDSGRDLPGRFADGIWQVRHSLTAGPPNQTFSFGGAGDTPLIWSRVS